MQHWRRRVRTALCGINSLRLDSFVREMIEQRACVRRHTSAGRRLDAEWCRRRSQDRRRRGRRGGDSRQRRLRQAATVAGAAVVVAPAVGLGVGLGVDVGLTAGQAVVVAPAVGLVGTLGVAVGVAAGVGLAVGTDVGVALGSVAPGLAAGAMPTDESGAMAGKKSEIVAPVGVLARALQVSSVSGFPHAL